MPLKFTFDFDKSKATLLYLAGKNIPEFTKYKAVKLLFLADREHLLRFGRPITGDNYDALPYGPVPSHILTTLSGMEAILSEETQTCLTTSEAQALAQSFVLETGKYPMYRAVETPDLDQLSESDILILDEIARRFGHSSFTEIFNFTHGLKAYTAAWRENTDHRKFPMSFEDFFLDAPEKASLLEEIREDQAIQEKFPGFLCA